MRLVPMRPVAPVSSLLLVKKDFAFCVKWRWGGICFVVLFVGSPFLQCRSGGMYMVWFFDLQDGIARGVTFMVYRKLGFSLKLRVEGGSHRRGIFSYFSFCWSMNGRGGFVDI